MSWLINHSSVFYLDVCPRPKTLISLYGISRNKYVSRRAECLRKLEVISVLEIRSKIVAIVCIDDSVDKIIVKGNWAIRSNVRVNDT